MKTVIYFLMVAASASLLGAESPAITRDDLKATVLHMQQLAHELQADLDAATAAKLALSAHLAEVESTLQETQGRADALQGQLDEQARLQAEKLNRALLAADQAGQERDRARADLAHVLGRYHTLKLLGSALAAGLAFLLVWKWSPPVVGPWGWALYAGVPVLAFGAFFVSF